MQENETKKFNKNAYDMQYAKDHYKQMKLNVKPCDYDIIDNFCKDLQISRQKFMINCALYIINHDMIDDIM